MKIKFDTSTISEWEATGVIALLMELFPGIGAQEETTEVHSVKVEGPSIAEAITEAVTDAIEETGDLVAQTSLAPSNLDAKGRSWDERIHASSKAKNADGTWRAKRGVAAELVAEVEAELAAKEDDLTPIDHAGREVEEAELAGSPTDELDAVEEEVRVLPADEPAVTVAPPPPPQAPAVTFPVVMKKITDNKILPAKVQELLAPFGLKSVGELLKPDRVADLAAFNAKIDEELAQ